MGVCGHSLSLYLLLGSLQITLSLTHPTKPNIILFLADDLGYGDLASYGHPTQEPGAVDRMAEKGIKFTQFYSPHAVCSPSRAALLTGRFVARYGLIGDNPVMLDISKGGLPHSEITIAEILQKQGYSTGMVGKWHLGINQDNNTDGLFLPHTQGFDYVGHNLPFTLTWKCDDRKRHMPEPDKHCFLYRNDTIVQQPINLDTLTSTLLDDAKNFISENRRKPFFLYFSFGHPHIPMYASEEFWGKSKRGSASVASLYGDQVNEMNWAVGEILEQLECLGLEEDTLVMFVSDHGAFREVCADGGSNGMLKGGKGNFYEGGVRVPFVAWWPGTIKPGQRSTSVHTLTDLLPTITELAGGSLPKDRILDGQSFTQQLLRPKQCNKPENTKDRGPLFFMCNELIMAARYKEFKVHFRIYNTTTLEAVHRENCDGYVPRTRLYVEIECANSVLLQNPEIYNLHVDPSEEFPLDVNKHQGLLEELNDYVKDFLDKLVVPDRIMDTSRMDDALAPCCNPPHCACP